MMYTHWSIDPTSRIRYQLFAKVWATCKVPSAWKEGITIFLYKGKDPRNDCASYRPISMLSVPGKVFAHTMYALISSGVTKYCLDSSISILITSSNLDQIKAEATALSYTSSSVTVIHAHPSLLSEWSICMEQLADVSWIWFAQWFHKIYWTC